MEKRDNRNSNRNRKPYGENRSNERSSFRNDSRKNSFGERNREDESTSEDSSNRKSRDLRAGSKNSRFKQNDSTSDDRGDRKFTKNTRNDGRYSKARENSDREFSKRDREPKSFSREDRGDRKFTKNTRNDGRYSKARENSNREFPKRDREPKSFSREDRGDRKFENNDRNERNDSSSSEVSNTRAQDRREASNNEKPYKAKNSGYSKKKQLEHNVLYGPEDGLVRINRYIANTGVCSRREADRIISEGKVIINGKVNLELGTKVSKSDVVTIAGKVLEPENKIYLLLNKPKDCLTTMDDPTGRRTVVDLIAGACDERIYPVGRLDRSTTGLLVFTNDGDLTKKLTHPSYEKKKIYHVVLDEPLSEEKLDNLAQRGADLEDGLIIPDAVSFVKPGDRREIGIEIHSGKNRVVRRIFEHLGHEVEKLDRVYFAGLTKKNLPRGKWRFLTQREINMLKNF